MLPVVYSESRCALPGDGNGLTMGNSVVIDEAERVRVEQRLQYSQELFCTKKWEFYVSESKAGGLDVELMNNAILVSFSS